MVAGAHEIRLGGQKRGSVQGVGTHRKECDARPSRVRGEPLTNLEVVLRELLSKWHAGRRWEDVVDGNTQQSLFVPGRGRGIRIALDTKYPGLVARWSPGLVAHWNLGAIMRDPSAVLNSRKVGRRRGGVIWPDAYRQKKRPGGAAPRRSRLE